VRSSKRFTERCRGLENRQRTENEGPHVLFYELRGAGQRPIPAMGNGHDRSFAGLDHFSFPFYESEGRLLIPRKSISLTLAMTNQ